MSVYKCPQCATNIYSTPTGWRHHNTGTESCYDTAEDDDTQAHLLGITW
jgi:hypothetical protein